MRMAQSDDDALVGMILGGLLGSSQGPGGAILGAIIGASLLGKKKKRRR